jgi:hypothetical protein
MGMAAVFQKRIESGALLTHIPQTETSCSFVYRFHQSQTLATLRLRLQIIYSGLFEFRKLSLYACANGPYAPNGIPALAVNTNFFVFASTS